jgi:hypothetical protein
MAVGFTWTDYLFCAFQANLHLLSPTLSSILNGGEGEGALHLVHPISDMFPAAVPLFLPPIRHEKARMTRFTRAFDFQDVVQGTVMV